MQQLQQHQLGRLAGLQDTSLGFHHQTLMLLSDRQVYAVKKAVCWWQETTVGTARGTLGCCGHSTLATMVVLVVAVCSAGTLVSISSFSSCNADTTVDCNKT